MLPAAAALAAEAVALAVAPAAAASDVAPAVDAEAAAVLTMAATARATAARKSAREVPVPAEACTTSCHMPSRYIQSDAFSVHRQLGLDGLKPWSKCMKFTP